MHYKNLQYIIFKVYCHENVYVTLTEILCKRRSYVYQRGETMTISTIRSNPKISLQY